MQGKANRIALTLPLLLVVLQIIGLAAPAASAHDRHAAAPAVSAPSISVTGEARWAESVTCGDDRKHRPDAGWLPVRDRHRTAAEPPSFVERGGPWLTLPLPPDGAVARVTTREPTAPCRTALQVFRC